MADVNENQNVLILASAAYSATNTGADLTNLNCRGVVVTVDITTVGTATWTIAIQGKDPVSGKYNTLLTSAALAANATTMLTLYPGLTAIANVTVSGVLPITWRIVATLGGSGNITGSIGAVLIV
jgi:hypothetical protein